jgi:hypothetical protein
VPADGSGGTASLQWRPRGGSEGQRERAEIPLFDDHARRIIVFATSTLHAAQHRHRAAMNTGAIISAGLALVFVIVIVVATLRTKSRQRQIRRALGLPARMETSTAEAQARQAVRVYEETDLRLTTTTPLLSKAERRKMACAIVREKGLLPKTTVRRKVGTPR